MTAHTNTQRTAKHRLAVKEKIERYERALREIHLGSRYHGAMWAESVASGALYPADPDLSAINPVDPAKS